MEKIFRTRAETWRENGTSHQWVAGAEEGDELAEGEAASHLVE